MGTVLLLLLYGVLSLALAGAVGLWSRRRPSLVASTVLTLLPLTFTAAGLLPGKVLGPTVALAGIPPWSHPDLVEQIEKESTPANPLLVDPLSQMEPWREASRHDLLFNPAASAGAALLGNGQAAGLFPLEVLARLLPPVRATTFLQVARLLLAAWGMFLFCRSLAQPEIASLLAVTAFLGSSFVQIWRLHTLSYVVALAPWILVVLVALVRRPSAGRAVLLAVLGALGVFAGHPETLLQVLVFGGLVVLPICFRRPRRTGKVVLWACVAAILSGLLAAPALLVFLENLQVSYEWKQRQMAAHQSVEAPLPEALERLSPALDFLALGDPRAGTWVGPENLAEVGGGSLALVALALIPAAFTWRRTRRRALGWLCLGLAGLLVGAHMPWISIPFGWVPGLQDTLLKRLSLWWVISGSVLVGFAARNLLRGRGRGAVLGAALGLAALLEVLAVWGPVPSSPARVAGHLVQLVAVVLVCSRPSKKWTPVLLVTLLLVPRVALLRDWIPLSSSLSFYPVTPAVDFVQERAEGYRVSGLGASLTPHSAAFFGLEDVRGYDPLAFAPYVEFSKIFSRVRRPGWGRIEDWAHPALDFLGVRFLFDHPTMYIFHHPGVLQVYEGEDAMVFENPRAFKRIFRPENVEVVATADLALERVKALEDFHLQAVASGDGLPSPGRYPNGALEISGLKVAPRRLEARVAAGGLALVATSQPAIPGWRLWVDGKEREPVRVNGAFLGALVQPGRHEVAFRYAPKSWRLGWILFGVGVFGAGLILRRYEK